MGTNNGNNPAPPANRSYRGSVGGVKSVTATGAGRWALVDAVQLAQSLAAVAAIGGGLLCGVTRDGGSCALTLFYSDDRLRFYPATDDELHDLLKDLEFWAALDAKKRTLAWFSQQ